MKFSKNEDGEEYQVVGKCMYKPLEQGQVLNRNGNNIVIKTVGGGGGGG